ncbi:MAG TPA: competence protein CoiA family protein [Clostridiales bacterium]|nr:competence protein CoiA family protein [Clostridiales bacterium]
MELKLPFGMKDGKLVQVADVEQGLKCGCVCPACGQPLVARKGVKMVHHFAHHNITECRGALETALHIAAKDILEKYKKFRVPCVTASTSNTEYDDLIVYEPKTLTCNKVYLEKRFDDIIPDVIVEINGKPLIIEIAVTHFIDSEKKNKIAKHQIAAIEIDLSRYDRQITFDELETILFVNIENKKWIYNPKRERINNIFKDINSKGIKRPIIQRGFASHIDNCPEQYRVWKGKFYANFIDDCTGCDYFVDRNKDTDGSTEHIICAGHLKKLYTQAFVKNNLKYIRDTNRNKDYD